MTNLHTEVRFSIVPEWVIDADISDRAVRVYAILARYADSETHQAFPSRETLAKRARCHWRSIDRAIGELIQLGAVTKTHRKNGKEYQSNIYTLKRVLPRVPRGTATGDTGVLTGESVGTDTAGNLTRTTKQEPQERKPLNDITEQFNEFWATYPRRTGKGNARKALEKALEKTSIDDILAGAERYRDDPNREDAFTQYPATWLNAEGWEDDPLPLRVTAGVRKLTNAEQGALLVRKYEAEEAAEKLRPKEIDVDYGSMMKGIDSE